MNVIVSHPIFARLQSDMQRLGLQDADLSNVTDLHAERVRRNREASERKYHEAHDFFEPEPAA